MKYLILSLLTNLGFSAVKPNIIVVFIDDMGYSDFSCFGGSVKTEHIDRLATEGLKFTNFYVNSPICSPSRVALTTGQYPQRHRITSYLNNRRDNKKRGMAQWLDPKAPTLARQLQKSGYATGHFGKWHMGGQRDVDDAPEISKYGFDRSLSNFEGMGPKLLPLTMKPNPAGGEPIAGRIWADAERLGKGFQWRQRSEITTGFVDEALTFIDKSQTEEKPFFINLWPDDVHGPWWPPLDKWGGSKRKLYQGVLDAMDEQLARLFDRVRNDPNLRDNTLITVCSDNGHEPGAGTSDPFRGAKTWMYEGGIRSPSSSGPPDSFPPTRLAPQTKPPSFPPLTSTARSTPSPEPNPPKSSMGKISRRLSLENPPTPVKRPSSGGVHPTAPALVMATMKTIPTSRCARVSGNTSSITIAPPPNSTTFQTIPQNPKILPRKTRKSSPVSTKPFANGIPKCRSMALTPLLRKSELSRPTTL